MGGRQRVVISWIPARLLGKPDFSGHPKIPSTNYPAPRQGGGSYLFIARPGTRLAEPVQVYAHGVGTRGISAAIHANSAGSCLPTVRIYSNNGNSYVCFNFRVQIFVPFCISFDRQFFRPDTIQFVGKTRSGMSGYFILSKKKTGQKMRRDNLF